MRIGLAIELTGRPGWRIEPPSFDHVRSQGVLAERTGFDLLVIEDVLSMPLDDVTVGAWESVVVLSALAEATTTIRLGHGVVNAPYRSPGHLAKIAETLDEVSGGRYVLGLGSGNTPDADYHAYGIPADRRYSRFVEYLRIVHDLLRHGSAELDGRYHTVRGAQLVLRGPRPAGPPIVVGAQGPKMLRATAQLADEWNWWVPPFATPDQVRPLTEELTRACEEVGRDPDTLGRSLDVYFPVAPSGWERERDGDPPQVSDADVVESLLAYGELGIGEVRCYLPRRGVTPQQRLEAIEDMADIVAQVQQG